MLDIRRPVRDALDAGVPIVALESTVIAHGLPWPTNLETAQAVEAAIVEEGAVPATIAVWHGVPTIGLGCPELEALARAPDVRKASRRDLAAAISQKAYAATTVAATMALAQRAGIRVFATGGIGGVHPAEEGARSWDVSADLYELARTPVAVVCAGAKSILDLPATLEMLETLGVPVVGYGTDDFPAFYLQTSGLPVGARADSPAAVGELLVAHWALGGHGAVIAQPLSATDALDPVEFATVLAEAQRQARAVSVCGPKLTPFLLARLAELTDGRTLRANQALLLANARLAAHIARSLPREK